MSQELIVSDVGILARAELDIQIATAKAYPRNSRQSIEYAEELATMDEATAQSCFYCLPRKDKEGNRKEIKGASVRLAEIIASTWGNLHAATRLVENDGRQVTAEACAWDLQTNVKITVQTKVLIWFGEDKAKGKKGYQANADMQTMLSNAAASKALRNAIFKIVPKALIDRVLEKAMAFSIGDQKSISTKINEVIDKLVKMGIDKEKMLNYYSYTTISQITAEDYKSLIGVGTAIKEGYIKPEQVFCEELDATNTLSAAEKLNNLIHEKKNKDNKDEVNLDDDPY